MNPSTDKKHQWAWFAILWCGGLIATLALSYLFRWVVTHL